MKRIYSLILTTLLCISALAQNAVFVSRTNGVTDAIAVTEVEQTFSADGRTMIINGQYAYPTEEVADITYGELPKKLRVTYARDIATVVNPYVTLGVTVTINAAHVTIDNPDTTTEITTELTGITVDGSLTYNGSYKTTIVLNGVTIENLAGPALDIQCGKRVTLELKKGTDNTLKDSSDGKQKAALYCKGHLEIDKSGNLTVTGRTKHAISAKEYIQVKNGVGTITILGAPSDGIHAGQYFLANGGNFVISVEGDGIQAELSGDAEYGEDYPDGSLNIQGGTFEIGTFSTDAAGLKADGDVTISNAKSDPVINITTFGDGSKGIKADGTVTVNAGTLTFVSRGNMIVEEANVTYSNAIKCLDFVGNGGTISITASGESARGISTDNALTVNGGTYTIVNSGEGREDVLENDDNCTAKGLKADGDIRLLGGTIDITMSGSGGKGIKGDGTLVIGDETTGQGPALTVTTTGSSLGSSTGGGGWPGGGWAGGGGPGGGGWPGGGGPGGESSGASSAKAIKIMGAIKVYGGEMEVTTASDGAEGLESKTSIEIFGGKSYFKCYDDCINSAGQLIFDDGVIVCHSFGNDAVDSNFGRAGSIIIRDASLLVYSTRGGAEMGMDADGMNRVQITGNANIVSLGGNQGGGGGSSASLGSASQGYGMVTTSTRYDASYYYTLADASGKNLLTFKLDANLQSSCALYTAAGMTRSASYTVKSSTTAPTDATMAFHGLYLGSTAAGTTNVTSFTAK